MENEPEGAKSRAELRGDECPNLGNSMSRASAEAFTACIASYMSMDCACNALSSLPPNLPRVAKFSTQNSFLLEELIELPHRFRHFPSFVLYSFYVP